jgi:hypothetical protein
MIRKDVVTAVIATSCLTAALFLIIPTNSQYQSYDPWLDVNDDGKINMLDLYYPSLSYGTFGDPTKNVNVTNWPIQPTPKTIIVCQNYTVTYTSPQQSYWLPFMPDIEGYRFVSVFVAGCKSGDNSAIVRCSASCMNITSSTSFCSLSIGGSINPSPYWENAVATNLEAGSSNMGFVVYINAGSVELTIVLYCYN